MVESVSTCHLKSKTKQIADSRFVNGLNGSETGVFLSIERVNRKWWFLMDSGNLDKNKISHATASNWNIKTTIDSGRVDIRDLNYQLCGISKEAPSVVDEIIYDGVLSFDYLSQFTITISFAEQKVWLE